MPDWLRDHQELLKALGIASIVMLVLSAVLVPLIVTRLPADHFVKPPATTRRHPVLHLLVLVVQNTLGVALVLLGIVLIPLPGQGILTILFGLALITGPGKRRVEVWILRRQSVGATIGWLRTRAGKRPLELPGEEGRGASGQG